MADWSSLPSDLVVRIGDCLLATNDVDCYMDFRAVCTNWRSSTDEPKNSSELRFRPRRWIIIDEVEIFQSDSRLLVNTLSGRVVRKDLPLLRRFCVVATTLGGFFVLAEKEPPHAVCVLNPFTGNLIQFMAPLPLEMDLSAAVVGSSPSVVLLSDNQRTCTQYVADPDSECFTCHEEFNCRDTYHMNRLAFLGGVYGKGERGGPVAPFPVGVAAKISDMMMMFPTMFPSMSLADCCFIAEYAGQVFVILNLRERMVVCKLDTDGEVLEPVSSIGNLAIFVGSRRCFTVNAEKFPFIGASCIYYVKSTEGLLDIYEYDLKEDKEERVCEAIYSLENPSRSLPDLQELLHARSQGTSVCTATLPFTLIQLLSSYTTNVRPSDLEDEAMNQYWSDRSAYEDALSDYLGDYCCY